MTDTKSKILWYKNRLLCMSVPEMLSRIRDNLRRPLQKSHSIAPTFPDREGATWLDVPKCIDPQPYTDCADSILNGIISMFGVPDLEFGHPPNWNEAAAYPGITTRQGTEFDKLRFADLNKDIKFIWEPSRHHHLVTLCQAYKLSGEQKYLDGLLLQLESWLRECPYPTGPNWLSPLEAGIRLINWSAVWQLIGGLDAAVFKTDQGNVLLHLWLRSIHQHCQFIANKLSGFSSANNHLIGEAAGLFIASLSWPMWQESSTWRDRSQAILEREMNAQTHADGVGKEQAFSYLTFILDFFWVSGIAGKANGVEFSPSWWLRIESMLVFIASVMDVKGNVPMVGDADDGHVLLLSREPDFCPYRSQLATGAVWYARGDLLAKAGRLDDKTRWLLGAASNDITLNSKDSSASQPRRHFPEGGYHILGSDFETPREVRMLIDTGPLGYLSIAAHGHADSLSVMLSVGGREFLVDPGTFSYNSEPDWRQHFRGTASHNTIMIDGQDQSNYCGSFMWRRHALTHCLQADDTRILASHNGYCRLPDPLTHQREVSYDYQSKSFVIIDALSSKSDHCVEQHWHFSEHCELEACADGYLAKNDGYSIQILLDTSLGNIELFKADENSKLGWVSRDFGVRKPATTIACRGVTSGESFIETRIICMPK